MSYEATRRDEVAVWLANAVLVVLGTKAYRDSLRDLLTDGLRWRNQGLTDVFNSGFFQDNAP